MLKKQVQFTEYQYVKGVLENDPQALKKIYQDHLSGIIAMVKKNNGSTHSPFQADTNNPKASSVLKITAPRTMRLTKY